MRVQFTVWYINIIMTTINWIKMKFTMVLTMYVILNTTNPSVCTITKFETPSQPTGYTPLLIVITRKKFVGYILNVSYQSRLYFFPASIHVYACPNQGEKLEIPSSTSNWLRAVDAVAVQEDAEDYVANNKLIKNLIEQKENHNKCDKPVIPAFQELPNTIVQDEFHKIAAIGFEVYFGNNYKEMKMDQYEYKYFCDEGITLEMNTFRWFTILLVQFDRRSLDVKNVSYKMNEFEPHLPDPEPTTEELKKYDLGKNEFYESLDIAELYSITNQELVFSEIFPNEDTRSIYFNTQDAKILVPLHLAPLNIYTVPHIREAAKTFTNIAPMWKVIRDNAWNKLEYYLHLLTQVIREHYEKELPTIALEIITGTHKVFEFPEEKKVFLGSNEKVSVPLAFYKIVALQTSSHFYSILIVTINNPYKEVEDILCGQDMCEIYGWKAIQNYDHTTGRTICCEMNANLATTLNLKPAYFENNKILDLRNKDLFRNQCNDKLKIEMDLEQCIEFHKDRVNKFFQANKKILANRNITRLGSLFIGQNSEETPPDE